MPEKEDKEARDETVELLWVDISRTSKIVQFALCCTFVFVFYLMYGYLQEFIFSREGLKPFGWYLTLIQFLYQSILALIELKFRKGVRLIPLKTYYILAFLNVGTLGFSNSSLKYLNYPTQVIFKCCKLIPVMIGGIIIQKKEYHIIDYLASCAMCLGLIAFTLADSQISPNFHILGVLMILSALICDALIGNVQEKAMKIYKAPNFEIIFYSSFIGFFYLLFGLLLSGDLLSGYRYFNRNPDVYLQAFVFALCGFLGVQVVLTLVRTCGALTTVTVTNCRKAVSIIISFLFFEKPFTYQYIWAGLLIVLGIYLNVLSKNRTKIMNSFRSVKLCRKEKSLMDVV